MNMTTSEQAQHVVGLLAQGQFPQVEALAAESIKPFLLAAQLAANWRSLEQQLGAFQQQMFIHTVQTPQMSVEVVTCAFAKMPFDINLIFNPEMKIIGLTMTPVGTLEQQANPQYTPPPYATVDRFMEQEVQIGSGEWALPGTLTLPTGPGPFPAVVLVHGSGPHDRDETTPPNKPFRDLAWGLASNGIAVLRYDKRTKVYAAEISPLASTFTVQQEVIEDVLLALDLLCERPEIDGQQLFVLGHSLGGYLLPRILSAPAASMVCGGIIMAGPARPLEDIMLDLVTYIASLSDQTPGQQQQLEKLARKVARVKDPQLTPATPASDLPLNVAAAYWLDLRNYHPAEVARHLPQPLLILQAGNDYQVTQADFHLWQQALSQRTDVTFKAYPDLYHLFMPSEPGHKATPVAYTIANHVTTQVINDISTWIKQHQ
ncbi:alpha/beta hydrolase [Dictyobacter formicarum]|uniref:Serine aminopeptidase S33 domain-containing protein n=1 Tax=Dictyobacter formicarum TaxID=2778368 RepID=A0ABQ3VJ93_9CHLR|nr:alpha/beta fold hydrolase [Dictyobacter formicarum]GHO85731.1 hypothetical protein KSZ_37370 [Dictyobacter formicarum]